MNARFRSLGGALLAASLLLLLIACSGRATPPTGEEHSYTVTAEVVRVSAPDAPRREIVLQHEAVPDFVDIDGNRVGMEAMTMPFPVATGVDLTNFQPTDHVRATFVVRFHGSPAYEVTQLEKTLPSQ